MSRYQFQALCHTERQDGQRWWVARCRNHHIAVQTKSKADLAYELARVIAGRIAIAAKLGIENPFEDIRRTTPL